MDIDAVVSSLAERDKWLRRLSVLRQSLGEVRAKRTRWQARLKRLEGDLRRVTDYSESILDPPRPSGRRAG